MSLGRAPALVPLLVLLCALSFGTRARLGTRVAQSAPEVAEQLASAAAACGVHGCGCPHEVVEVSCCCAGEEPVPAPRVTLAPPPTLLSVTSRPDLPPATLAAFHCSGGKHGRASAHTEVAPAAVPRPSAAPALAVTRCWSTKNEPGPRYDLRQEPATPPPRPDARA